MTNAEIQQLASKLGASGLEPQAIEKALVEKGVPQMTAFHAARNARRPVTKAAAGKTSSPPSMGVAILSILLPPIVIVAFFYAAPDELRLGSGAINGAIRGALIGGCIGAMYYGIKAILDRLKP